MRGLTPAQRAFDAQVVDGPPKAGHDAAGRYAASRYCPRLSCRTPPTVMPGLGRASTPLLGRTYSRY